MWGCLSLCAIEQLKNWNWLFAHAAQNIFVFLLTNNCVRTADAYRFDYSFMRANNQVKCEMTTRPRKPYINGATYMDRYWIFIEKRVRFSRQGSCLRIQIVFLVSRGFRIVFKYSEPLFRLTTFSMSPFRDCRNFFKYPNTWKQSSSSANSIFASIAQYTPDLPPPSLRKFHFYFKNTIRSMYIQRSLTCNEQASDRFYC